MLESCEGMSCLGPSDDSDAETCLNALKVQRNDAITEDCSSVLAPGRVRCSGPDLVLLGLCSPENCSEMAAEQMLGRATVICLSDSFFPWIISVRGSSKGGKCFPVQLFFHVHVASGQRWAHLQNQPA